MLLPIAAALVVLIPPPIPGPAPLSKAAADSITAAILKYRADNDHWLASAPTSYLAAVQRRDFGERRVLTVGRAPGSDVRIDDPEVSARHLRVTVVGDSFRVEAIDPEARFVVKDEARRTATLGPGAIGLGRFQLRLSHQRFPAIIVFDPKSPRLKEYRPLAYFPVDLALRYELTLLPNPRPDTVVILSTRGNQRRALRVGWFHFKVGARKCDLEATRLLEPGVGENDLSVFFRDATSGKQSYVVGRYLDPERLPDGRYVLDFNLAYNPACAISDHYNCPLPPRDNQLPIAVRAGEMDSHYLKH